MEDLSKKHLPSSFVALSSALLQLHCESAHFKLLPPKPCSNSQFFRLELLISQQWNVAKSIKQERFYLPFTEYSHSSTIMSTDIGIAPVDQSPQLFPCRVDLSLPGTFRQLLPIPLNRLYDLQHAKLTNDCFDILDYTVQLLLDVASHLSPTERERLSSIECNYVHPESGLVILHATRSFANYSWECILAEHNSTDPLVLSASWPSVFFDENGYPSFCETKEQQEEEDALKGEHIPLGAQPPSGGTAARGSHYMHHAIPLNAGHPQQQRPAVIPDYHARQQQQPQANANYCKSQKRRKHPGLQAEPDEYSTLTFPRL